jgi:hypothetical protein
LKRKEKKKNHLHVDLFVVFLPPGNFRREPVRRAQAGRHRHLQSRGIKKKKKRKKNKKNDVIVNQQESMQRGKHASQAKRNKDTPTNQISRQAQPSQEAQWHADSHQGQQASPCTKPGHQAKPRETKTAPKPKKDTMTRQ